MAIPGQKFSLDLEADNFAFNVLDDEVEQSLETPSIISELREKETTAPPPPPKLRSKSGFPEHRPRKHVSTFKQRQQQSRGSGSDRLARDAMQPQPSDRAIAHHVGRKLGVDTESQEKAQISEENKQKLANMSVEDIEEARAELMSNLNPALLQRLLKRANIEEDQRDQNWEQDTPTATAENNAGTQALNGNNDSSRDVSNDKGTVRFKDLYEEMLMESDGEETPNSSDLVLPAAGTTHFPLPPRDASSFAELDPNSPSFLQDLKTHYFPGTPHDTSSLSWLRDPTEEENASSAYAPTQTRYAPSDIRFDFTGRLIPPSESSEIPVSKGLHHHGEAPDSAGYTVPELAMLVRSTLPNQRCIAYQTLGRVLYRLGHGDFGPRGTELVDGLWGCIEHERPVEVMMAEANRQGGHASAKAYATEGLWLWRRGGGGDRGVLKQNERIAQ